MKDDVKLGTIYIAPMGVLAPGSAHTRPSAQPPIDTSRIFPAHMSEAFASFLSVRLRLTQR